MFRETITAPVHSAISYFDNTKIDESEMEDLINNVDHDMETTDDSTSSKVDTKEQNDQYEDADSTNLFMYTNEIRVENNLLKLLSDMNVPNDSFKKIMDWARNAYNTGYQFNPKSANYKSLITQMESYSNLNNIRPHNKRVMLQNKLDDTKDTTAIDVVCCDFTSMLFSLLQDKTLNQNENLVVNKSDFFSKYVSSNGRLNEVNSGSWYDQAYITMVKDFTKDFIMPIIFAMDKTTISSTARMSVYAVMFTTTIFDHKARNKAHAWRPLGYIPIEKNFYSTAQWSKMDKELKSIRENAMYTAVLQSFIEAQKTEGWTMSG